MKYTKYKMSFAEARPEAAAEWDYEANAPLTPDDITPCAAFRATWICSKCGQKWQSTVGHRFYGATCPHCRPNMKRVPKPGQSLADLYPDVLKDWDYEANGDLRPEDFKPKSGTAVFWKCHICGHKWKTTICNRTSGHGCRQCANRKLATADPGESFAELYPELMKDWDYDANTADPYVLKPNTDLKVSWKCHVCGHKWKTTTHYRASGRPCPACRKRQNPIQKAESGQSLQELYPTIAAEWDYDANKGITPAMVKPGSHYDAAWICRTCDNLWHARVSTRVEGHGCPVCARTRKSIPLPGESFADFFPDLAEDWDYHRNRPLKPYMVKPYSRKSVHWKCYKCGHTWTDTIYHRTRHPECPECADRFKKIK